MLGTIKCTLGLWHEVRPLKPPLSSDWLAAKTSQLSLVEAGGLALAKEPPDKMQGATKCAAGWVESVGWKVHWPVERSTNIFHRAHQLPRWERSRVGPSQTGDPRSRSAKQVMHGLYDGSKIAKLHILWLGSVLYSCGTSESHNQAKASDQDSSIPIM